jgi:hypothetical protein
MFAIDRALQIYWLSCSEQESRRSINSKILQMQDLQSNIERHKFHDIIPKILADKCTNPDENPSSSTKEKGKRDLKDKDKEGNKKQRIEETFTNSGI